MWKTLHNSLSRSDQEWFLLILKWILLLFWQFTLLLVGLEQITHDHDSVFELAGVPDVLLLGTKVVDLDLNFVLLVFHK